jgi:uncharacterized protein
MRVVLDTTTIISSFIRRDSYPYQAVDLWFQKEYTLVTSLWQVKELRETTHRPKIQEVVKPYEVGRLINLLKNKAIVLETLPEVTYSQDPKDNPILASAIAGQAQYVVSGDKKHMLSLGVVQGIPITTVKAFVELFIKPA